MNNQKESDPSSTHEHPTVADLPPGQKEEAFAFSARRQAAWRAKMGLPAMPGTGPLPKTCPTCGNKL